MPHVAQILTGQAADLITVRTGTNADKPTITWQRDAEAVAAASRLDGFYVLATNLPGHPGASLTAQELSDSVSNMPSCPMEDLQYRGPWSAEFWWRPVTAAQSPRAARTLLKSPTSFLGQKFESTVTKIL